MCRPPTVLLENGSMVHNQANTNENGNDHLTPTVLLENGSMVHNQTNTDRLQKLSVTFLENGKHERRLRRRWKEIDPHTTCLMLQENK